MQKLNITPKTIRREEGGEGVAFCFSGVIWLFKRLFYIGWMVDRSGGRQCELWFCKVAYVCVMSFVRVCVCVCVCVVVCYLEFIIFCFSKSNTKEYWFPSPCFKFWMFHFHIRRGTRFNHTF